MIGEAGRGLAAELIPAVALPHPGRAKDRDPVFDVAQDVEPPFDLIVDPLQADVVSRLDQIARDPEQVFIVFGAVRVDGISAWRLSSLR
jgi:hypothetical protein